MRRKLAGVFTALSVSLLLMSGCAKDQVKPDEGVAQKPAPTVQPQIDQEAEKRRLAQQLADQEAARREAERQAAQKAEQVKEQQAKADAPALAQTASESSATADAAKKALSRIHFEFDSYALSQPSRDILYKNAEYLLKKYQGKVRLEGHCDERGSDEYNLALGETVQRQP